MHFKMAVLILAPYILVCESRVIYSSFWAPLFDRSILKYRVDAPFDPESGKLNREYYEGRFGYRGEKLIYGLGNGIEPSNNGYDKGYGDVKFYYTFDKAHENEV